MGANHGTAPEDTEHADLIVVWGGNIVSTNMHQVVLAEKARKKGAKIVVIDVHRNRTAQWADWFIPIYPGTDSALALGLMHVLFEQGLTNEEFMQKYTIGHEASARACTRLYTGTHGTYYRRAGRNHCGAGPALWGAHAAHIHIGNGLRHHDNGGMNVRGIACLPAITGQWLKRGGGAVRTNSYASTNSDALERPDLKAACRAAGCEHEPDWRSAAGSGAPGSGPCWFTARIHWLWHQIRNEWSEVLHERTCSRWFMICS